MPLVPDPHTTNITCYENSTIFLYANFIYIILAVSFSTSAPYRKPIYTNCKSCTQIYSSNHIIIIPIDMFVLVLVILLPCNLYLALAPHDWFPWVITIVYYTVPIRYVVIGYVVIVILCVC